MCQRTSLLQVQLFNKTMYNDGFADFVVDQGIYYPTATNYAYYCTGYQSPAEWEDQHNFFGIDGPEVQYAGVQTEGLPYVYYTPNHGYAQSPYNIYNPYIPGSVVGSDDPYLGAPQYYLYPPYQDSISSPSYVPVVVQADASSNSFVDPLVDTHLPFPHRTDGRSSKHGLASSSAAFISNPLNPAPNRSKFLNSVFGGSKSRANFGLNKHTSTRGDLPSSSYLTPASAHASQSRGASGSSQSVDNALAHPIKLNTGLPISNAYTDFGSNAHGVNQSQSKILASRIRNDMNSSLDAFGEQNRGPRSNKSKNQLSVKAYTTKVGGNSVQGSMIIHKDHYNKDDFPIDNIGAKFFVIKSYSEDDVHKCIKYNVWSSTSHGNKKLQSVYENSQNVTRENTRGLPIFLFFSVNASGQFCGVAEMIGPVDFHKDMDFWQQDKWSGSFPVKWHFIKDVSNTKFRYIILENNENKPVTNSRDTQEIPYKQGLEMLKIFKNHPLNTSLLDDFMYYESREKIMQEEKARHLFKSFKSPLVVPAIGPTHNLIRHVEQSAMEVEKHAEQKDTNSLKQAEKTGSQLVSFISQVNNSNTKSEVSEDTTVERESDSASLNISLHDINRRQVESTSFLNVPTPDPTSETVKVLTVGSMPVKVNKFAESSRSFRVGSISLDSQALELGNGGPST